LKNIHINGIIVYWYQGIMCIMYFIVIFICVST